MLSIQCQSEMKCNAIQYPPLRRGQKEKLSQVEGKIVTHPPVLHNATQLTYGFAQCLSDNTNTSTSGKESPGDRLGQEQGHLRQLHRLKVNPWNYGAEHHPCPETAVRQGRSGVLWGFHNAMAFHYNPFSPWEKGFFCKVSSLKFFLPPNCSNFYFSKYLLFSKFKIIVVARNHLEIFRTKPKH